MKKISIIIVCMMAVCLMAGLYGPASAFTFWIDKKKDTVKAEDANISFQFSFCAKKTDDGKNKIFPVTDKTILREGDQFKLMVKPITNCYVYIIQQNPQGELSLLFPYNKTLFEYDYKTLVQYLIPRGDDWFRLDYNKGTEILHVLASVRRLTKIEQLAAVYENAPDTDKAIYAGEIMSEIQNLKKLHRKKPSPLSRPVSTGEIAGNLYKNQSDMLLEQAVEISAKDFYCKTITIDHQ